MLTLSLILLPLLASLVLFAFKDNKWKTFALVVSVVELALVIWSFVGFNKATLVNYGFDVALVNSAGIRFAIGMDGVSLLMVLLTALLVPIIIYSTFQRASSYSAVFFGLILLMESALVGVFTAHDGLLFYIFWELALIPIYFICAIWGGETRIRVTLKFFIYTMLGSLFMLTGLLWLYLSTPLPHTFDIVRITGLHLCPCVRIWIFAAFLLAFAIKIPIFPFHSWQPDTYTVAPTVGSMLLAGVMLKMGLYGLIRFGLPLGGPFIQRYAHLFIPFALFGLLYASVIAIRQREIKRLIAYSSMSHVGLMAAAILTAVPDAVNGSVYQMLSHGVNVVGLFFVAEIIQRRTQTTQIEDLGGIARTAPRFAIFFMVVMLGSVALPLTNGFVGEFLMLSGLAQYNLWISGVAGVSIILGAVYMFRLYQCTMYGYQKTATTTFDDLNVHETIVAVVIIVLVIVGGLYPKPFLEVSQAGTTAILSIQ